MGLFDSLYVDLACPKTGLVKEVELQFKWSDPIMRQFHLGDQLDIGPYGNLWVPEEYMCGQCSTYEPIEEEEKVLHRKIQEWVGHTAYIHLDNGKFLDVLTQEGFVERFGKLGERLPEKEVRWMPYWKYENKE